LSAIEGLGGSSDFGEGVKNCKLFEERATSSCNLATTKIATRNPHEAKNSTFYGIIKIENKPDAAQRVRCRGGSTSQQGEDRPWHR
jgi:hypothetical protein